MLQRLGNLKDMELDSTKVWTFVESKHLKGHLAPRVSDVTFLGQRFILWQPVSDVPFLGQRVIPGSL